MQKALIALLIFIGFLFLTTCEKDNPSSSDPDPSENPNVVSKDIGPDGGEISSKDGNLTLVIPANALGNMETLTIEEINTDNLGAEFDAVKAENAWGLGPDGLQFEQPITVRFQTDQTPTDDDTTLTLIPELLLTSKNGEVEPLDNLIVEGNADNETIMVEGQLSHFSPLVDDKLDEYLVEFQVFGVPDQVVVDKTFYPQAILKDPNSYVKAEPDPPTYNDLSNEPIVLKGEDKSVPMTRGDLDFFTYLEYTCNGLGTGFFTGYIIVRGDYFRNGPVLRAEKNVECIESGEEPAADLQISISVPEDPVELNEEYTATTYIENLGPDYAENVTFTLTLSQGEIVETPDNENVECQITSNKLVNGHQVVCEIPELVPEDHELNFSITVDTQEGGEQTITGEVSSSTTDPDPGNNTDTGEVMVKDADSSTLPEGVFGGPESLTDWEALNYAAGNGNNSNGYYKQADEVAFGNLTGSFITAFAGAEGFVVLDLATGEVLLEETGLGGRGPFYGIAGATQDPPGSESPAMFLAAGENGYAVDRFGESGPLGLAGTTYDTYPAGGDPVSNVVPFVQPFNGVGFYVYDDSQELYIPAEVDFDVSQFDGKELISAYMHDDMLSDDPVPQPLGPVLVLTRETESGVYLAKWGGSDPVRAIDNIGFDARRIRCIETESTGDLICAASIFGHDRLGIMTWDGENLPVLTDFADIGDGPVGIDLRLLPNGNILIVATGFNDNTVTETEVSANGVVSEIYTRSVPGGCQNPGHAIYVHDDEGLKIVGSCYSSSNYFIIESEM